MDSASPKAPAHNIDSAAQIKDPIERAIAAQEIASYADARGRQARKLRDEALRACRERGDTRPEIAARTGINIATVKAVLR